MEPFVYEFYHEGFFGYSLEQDFQYYSFWHFLPMILLGLAIFLTYRYREKIKAALAETVETVEETAVSDVAETEETPNFEE